MNIELTNDEYLLIRGCLAIGYYHAKDEGNDNELEEITKLEHKLIAMKVEEL